MECNFVVALTQTTILLNHLKPFLCYVMLRVLSGSEDVKSLLKPLQINQYGNDVNDVQYHVTVPTDA